MDERYWEWVTSLIGGGAVADGAGLAALVGEGGSWAGWRGWEALGAGTGDGMRAVRLRRVGRGEVEVGQESPLVPTCLSQSIYKRFLGLPGDGCN